MSLSTGLAGERRGLSAMLPGARDGIQASPNPPAAAQVRVLPPPPKLGDTGVLRPWGVGVSARNSPPAASLT